MKNLKNIKKVLSLLIFNFILLTSLAQVPDAINFQAIARDSYGNVMGDTQIMIQLSILEGSAEGPQVYREIRSLMTNAYGSFAFQIGRDPYMNVGSFTDIDWADGAKFMKVDYDPTASLNFNLTLGTIEFVTVPYAFTARDVVYIDANGAVEGDVLVFNETTGKFEPGQVGASSIIWENIENKPNFALVATSGDYSDLINTPEIQEIPENLSEFNNDIGYLTDYTETDPEFSAWDKTTGISITESQISDFGNYIEAESQNLSDVIANNNSANGQIKNLSNPTDAQDAATKAYVDELIALFEANGMLVVDFSANTNAIIIGTSINFTDNSVFTATTWHWDFGDGNTSSEQNPSHIYQEEGQFTVSLTAGNGVLSSTKTKLNFIVVSNNSYILGTFTDTRDNYTYQTVEIGSQTWMAENLKYLPSVVGPGAGSYGDPYYYVYGYDGTDISSAKATENYQTYGVLYNWPAAMQACPTGWHLPSDDEWKELEMFLGMSQEQADEWGWRGTDEGGKLKETGITHWNSPNEGATNETGFTALPGGYRSNHGDFSYLGSYGSWWSATESDSNYAWVRHLYYNNSDVGRFDLDKDNGYSVRCVRD
ncbi:MAG: PKD domain-containing protein [Bacteroidales bacterium]|nr:PKD domain-containing protein [Bacteroidales bacterium]MCK9499550.1 PKD domain-containing protein [Bacteroidales bacterium]